MSRLLGRRRKASIKLDLRGCGMDSDDHHSKWPYASQYLLETLDPDLIEAHAVSILNRSLNVGRTVAFVGAGVSMSYGRLSWKQLVDVLKRDVLEKYDVKSSTYKLSKHIQRLRNSLKLISPDEGKDNKSDYPMMFQLCEQLDIALDLFDGSGSSDKPGALAASSFRARAMKYSIDDLAHSREILESACNIKRTREAQPGAGSELNLPIPDVSFQIRDARLYLEMKNEKPQQIEFSFKRLKMLREQLKPACTTSGEPSYCGILRDIDKYVDERLGSSTQKSNSDNKFVQPIQRYLIGTLLKMFPEGDRVNLVRECLSINPKKGDPQSHVRHHIIPFDRDPLLLLHSKLNISRFLTTNYDHEIDRMFADLHLSNDDKTVGSTHRQQRGRDNMSVSVPSSSVAVFDENGVGNMSAFASRGRSRSSSVVHLHGRADLKHGNIIVTESDYQKQYVNASDSRDLVENSLSLALGANPILFVGWNMAEDDIMRPLRQFMGAPGKLEDRSLIALIPGTEDLKKRSLEKVSLLGKYGVYSIHFGKASFTKAVELEKIDSLEKRLEHHVDWLCQYSAIHTQSLKALRKYCSIGNNLNAEAGDADGLAAAQVPAEKKFLEAADELMTVIQFRCSQPTQSSKKDRSDDARAIRRVDGEFEIRSPTALEGLTISDNSELDISFETAILNRAVSFIKSASQKNQNSKTNNEPEGAASRDKVDLELAELLTSLLEGSFDSVLSAFTCARFIRARWEWDDWAGNWFNKPPMRIPHNGIESCEKSTKPSVLKVTTRHALDLPKEPIESDALIPFYQKAASQTFNSFLSSLQIQNRKSQPCDGTTGGARCEQEKEIGKFLKPDGRRILLLLTKRGVGSGHFFSTLENAERTGQLNTLLTKLGSDKAPHKSYSFAGLYNLSHSHEVMSVFDRISGLMIAALEKYYAGETEACLLSLEKKSLRNDRIGKMKLAMKLMNDASKMPDTKSERVFIAINAFGILFDKQGRAKNGQLKRLTDLVFDQRYRHAPIDFVLVCHETSIPHYFRDSDKSSGHGPNRENFNLLALFRNPVGQKEIGALESRAERLRISPGESTSLLEDDAEKCNTETVAFHFLHPTRANIIAGAFFPRVSALYTYNILRRLLNSGDNRVEETISALRPRVTESSHPVRKRFNREGVTKVRQALMTWNTFLEGEKLNIAAKDYMPFFIAYIAILIETNTETSTSPDDALERFLKDVRLNPENFRTVKFPNGFKSPEVFRAVLVESLAMDLMGAQKSATDASSQSTRNNSTPTKNAETSEATTDLKSNIIHLIHVLANSFDEGMRDLCDALGNSRYVLTIALAGAQETTLGLNPIEEGDEPQLPDEEQVRSVGEDVGRYFERLSLALDGVALERRFNTVLTAAMLLYQRHHNRNDRSAVKLEVCTTCWHKAEAGTCGETSFCSCKDDNTAIVKTYTTSKPGYYDLLNEILWHLSLLGQPSALTVLEHCPRIRRKVHAIIQDEIESDSMSSNLYTTGLRSRIIKAALDLGVSRCLIFRVSVGPDVRDLPGGRAEQEKGVSDLPQRHFPRYTVHRLVQKYYFERMGAPDIEFSQAEQFTLSIYATQPEDLPQLSKAAHHSITETISALAGYPDAFGHTEHHHELAEQHRAQDLKALLRGAYGIMRSIYSISTLARLDRIDNQSSGYQSAPGHFESYRLLVRWLMTISAELDRTMKQGIKELEEKPANKEPEEPEPKTSGPFYSEEIVWLFNECGVLSLAEGRLQDASALFSEALKSAKEIEFDELGPLHVRILLNRSIVDIERGNIGRAQICLTSIANLEGEHEVPILIAKGYLAQCSHLLGDLERAESGYKDAIEGLSDLGRSRATSIFCTQLGNLQRAMGPDFRSKSEQSVNRAFRLAQESGQQDIKHHAMLAQTRCDILYLTMSDVSRVHTNLNLVESYAHTIGIPRMLCEVQELRARLYIHQGDMRQAAACASKSLEIASMNDLTLRKSSAALLLARVFIKRGKPGDAIPLMDQTANWLKNTHHQAAQRDLHDLRGKLAQL